MTNSARHCGGANATVRLGHGDDALRVEVADDGTSRPPDRPPARTEGSGHGIAGMTERAAALGGTLEAGPRPEGGFLVRVWLPLHGHAPGEGSQHGLSQHGLSRHTPAPEEGER